MSARLPDPGIADPTVDSQDDQSFTRGRRLAGPDRRGLMSLFSNNYRPTVGPNEITPFASVIELLLDSRYAFGKDRIFLTSRYEEFDDVDDNDDDDDDDDDDDVE
uniref:Uncharacterized protein n=1 Tax=Vespula pensylvanica TaxID=30213 RepID=A0A834KZ59_VESPE|nr:hypothetical protein H0235_012682 [Vespula pensylvanica]